MGNILCQRPVTVTQVGEVLLTYENEQNQQLVQPKKMRIGYHWYTDKDNGTKNSIIAYSS